MTRRLIYMTAGTADEAASIGRTLVEERLAACVNILPGMTSIYRWQGALEEGSEVVMIAKTDAALVPELVARVEKLHSYDTPCVVSLSIESGSDSFLAWIGAETGTES